MKKMNDKGFTLIEVLAVIVIIAIIGLIAAPSVIKTIETSKQASYDILVENITVAGKQLFEEIEFTGNKLYRYDEAGQSSSEIQINNDKIDVNLQTLVSNGFLSGNNDGNGKVVINPKNNENIGLCEVSITKIVERIEIDGSVRYDTTYNFASKSTDNPNCPKSNEYAKYLG